MKLLALILSLALISGNVYSKIADDQQLEIYAQDNKEEISKEELPAVVIQEFNKSVYKEWSIEKVYKVEASNEVSYELHLAQPGETMVLIASAQGDLQPKADS